jgi:hypothetical protein
MQTWIVFMAYGGAVVLALLFLWIFRRKAWYLHVLALLIAFGVGLTPLPEGWQGRMTDIFVGSLFLFLFTWGICAPFFRARGA